MDISIVSLAKVVGPLFTVMLGVSFARAGVKATVAGRRLQRYGVRVPGVVAGVRGRRRRDKNDTVYYHTLRFQTVHGFVVEAESDLSFNPSPVHPGQQVMVVYNPSRPQHVRLDGVDAMDGCRGGLFLVIGTFMTVISLIVLAVFLLV